MTDEKLSFCLARANSDRARGSASKQLDISQMQSGCWTTGGQPQQPGFMHQRFRVCGGHEQTCPKSIEH